jgi:NH3-dependent NAD+ synthetase
MSEKFDNIVTRLAGKIKMSQTTVPGFILGLSGTDSIITFIALYRALSVHNMQHRLLGIHYVGGKIRKPTWFDVEIMPWLKNNYPEAQFLTTTPLGGNQDQQRWADLHLRALNRIEKADDGSNVIRALDKEDTYWVSGCMNATEKALGKYSIMAKSVSIDPIVSLWKSEIIALCSEFCVPVIAAEMSQLPDCLCGREEIAAKNVQLIDDILRFNVDPTKHSPQILSEVMAYVQETKRANDFKNRVPFNV